MSIGPLEGSIFDAIFFTIFIALFFLLSLMTLAREERIVN